MLEIVEPQAEACVSIGADDTSEFIQVGGLAVGGQTHDLVFVSELAKSEVLRNCRVIHAEGVRKRDRAIDLHVIAAADAPHGAGEIA